MLTNNHFETPDCECFFDVTVHWATISPTTIDQSSVFLPKWTLLPLLCRDSRASIPSSATRLRSPNSPNPPSNTFELEPAFRRRSYRMPSLVIPESGLSLQGSQGAGSKAVPKPQNVFGLTLNDAVMEEMIRCVQNGKGLQLSLGEQPVRKPSIFGCSGSGWRVD